MVTGLMSDIPSTSVVRHWVGWDQDEWDVVRAEQFDAWLDGEIRGERERIVEKLKESFGESYYNMGVVAEVLRIIRSDNE
jgi:hypothetical protein